MRRLLTAIAAIFSFAGAAQACPDYSLWGAESYELTGDDLYDPFYFDVTAGGEYYAPNCYGIDSSFVGFFTNAPDFSLELYGMNGYEISISVISDCDSALLINTPNTEWFYDDDSNGDEDPRLDLAWVEDGVLDIWIGTFDGEYCYAEMAVETF